MRIELAIIILSLATWRLAVMFAKETGPFHIFEKLRIWSGIQHDQDGNVLVVPNKFFAELLSCVWCASVWCAFFWTVLYLTFPAITPWLGLTFALSALAILIDRIA